MDKTDIEDVKVPVNHAQVLAMVTDGKEKYFYTRVTYDDFSHKDVRIQLDEMKMLGVAKTIRSFKKVENWFDTDAGYQWLSENYQ